MPVAQYAIGPPTRPKNIRHDNGFLDSFARRKPTAKDYEEYARWISRLEGVEAIQGVPFVPHNNLPDALAAYRHFLRGNGKDHLFSYERFVSSDPSGAVILSSAVLDARQGAELLYGEYFKGQSPVLFQMSGSAIPVGSIRYPSFPYPKTENWQKAIGAHVIWLSADVDVEIANGVHSFVMQMTLHAEDRYNFNPGAADIASGIPDSANGIFEVTGLAHQYMNTSTINRRVEWVGLGSPQGISPKRRSTDFTREKACGQSAHS
ncbi:hypothetical protein GeomeDRAFT_2218 [Geobacter metallireducens RCH3]|uniref:Uncharacterized protein n=1 Tax=Geobacter metallireducens (strain ATCC 53774 / DSM 7210 / GS-15) TaxID=269799 RepID=Q39YZ8_GEOMG|nr:MULTISPECIES: hypothetical protein [Geobacter]ABB30526.1 hypothetical protein Gmet_0281 [Geobacter metallireducens GS-15]EHP85967.1 hypothetical protein GeomeDRAFT_2218 [Geobacter metallireducens RCH3]MBT1076835.1 hypothetical protein [Geobacter grbiciae]